ncbi:MULTISPECIES: hypothetical protein [Microcystis]|uniref:hypothetical protein n=1 Tax=Microcystis TaxID=1125 RepID=UPI00092FEF32|nr:MULTISPECIES: hypothetical protein [Microcystis]MDB9390525.1 hypothetical protein [Microcystis aeruginosa CS-579]
MSSDVSSLKDLGGQSTHKRRGGNHQSLERVHRKVASGGHNIPEDVVRRRYKRGRKLFVI